MVQSPPDPSHSLDITTSVQALRQEVEPKSREKRLNIWWPVHITHRILTTSHQPNNLFQHKHSHALKAFLVVLPNMARQKRASHADEDASQPAVKRQKAPPGGSGTGSRQSIGVASLRNRTVRKSTQVAAATTTDPLHNSNSTTSENRPISALHGVKSRQRLQQKSARPSFKLRPPTSVALKVKPEAPNLHTIPLELQQKIFLQTTAGDTTRLRRVCKALNCVVVGSSNYLAKQFANRELTRLRCVVDEWTSLKMPTDINSLMEAMHVWIKRRGFMPRRSYACMESMRKLMAHLFVRKKTGGDLYLSAMRWSLVAVAVSYLHQRAVDPRDEDDDCDDELSFNLITAMGVLDYAECDRLFYCTEHPELQPRERRLCGRTWPAGTLEHATLPELRMTPLLNFERVASPLSDEAIDRANMLYRDYLDDENTNEPLEATHGSPALLWHLRLPELPNEVSCYHLVDEWAGREVEKIIAPLPNSARSRPTRVPPMLRAAILENVRLF
jgi:hypothetical protein